MLNKKVLTVLLLCLAAIACGILIVGCGGSSSNNAGPTPTPIPTGTPTPSPTPVPLSSLDMTNAYVIGDVFDKSYAWKNGDPVSAGGDGTGDYGAPTNGDGYYGPWGNVTLPNDGTFVFDTAPTGSYMTMDFVTNPNPVNKYQFAVIRIKSDIPVQAKYASMTWGNKGKTLEQWGMGDIDTSYKVYVIDLTAAGVNSWSSLRFAMNKDGSTDAKITVDYLKLANLAP